MASQLIIHRFHSHQQDLKRRSFSTNLKHNTCLSRFPSTSRYKNVVRLQTKERLFVAYASNSSPSGGESSKDKSGGISSDTAKGPPFFTIVAGFLVLFCIIWLFGSIIMWLFGLIIPASK